MTGRDEPQDTELASLYRDASRELPSAYVDARILAAARAAVPPPGRAPTPWINRWRVPFALTATVLLTSTLTLMLQDEEVAQFPVSITAPISESTAESTKQSLETRDPQPGVSARPPAEALSSAAIPRTEPASKRQEVPTTRASESAVGTSGAPKILAPAASSSASSATSDPAVPALRSAPESAPAAMRSSAAERVSQAERTLEQWLADIRKLKKDGQDAEAAASLAEFRKRYPLAPLPEDLRQP